MFLLQRKKKKINYIFRIYIYNSIFLILDGRVTSNKHSKPKKNTLLTYSPSPPSLTPTLATYFLPLPHNIPTAKFSVHFISMPNSSSKIQMLKNLIISDHGTCGCRKSKQKDILEPKPKAKITPKKPTISTSNFYPSSSISSPTTTTLSFRSTTRCSDETDQNSTATKMVNPYPKLGDSLAVVKDSDDPYGDFRQSMLQMILERDIHSKDDLQELLNCFLQLNSTDHHQLIVRAFMEIWNGVAASASGHSIKQEY